ncbi:Kv channel-interacting protein 4 isoform X2 [Tachysurus ichikawai]
MLGTAWETEGLQTLGIVVIVCTSLKLLHLLGLISFSEVMNVSCISVDSKARACQDEPKLSRQLSSRAVCVLSLA